MSSALSVGMAIDPAVLFPRVRGTARRDAARRGATRRDTVALPTWRFGLVYDTCPMSARDWDAALQRMLGRSEEHTSELQSRSDLVCRLLLEKKKHKLTL